MTAEREKLVLDNRNLVHLVIYRYKHMFGKNTIHEYEDMEQIGLVGLIKAANSYKPETNLTFSNYAYICIRNELISAATYDVRKNGLTYTKDDIIPVTVPEDRDLHDDSLFEKVEYKDLVALLHSIKKNLCKTLQLGIDAIILKSLGYTISDVSEMYGVPASHIYTYVKRAQQVILKDDRFVEYAKEVRRDFE